MDKRKDAKKMENNNMSNGMQQNGAAMNGPPIGYHRPPQGLQQARPYW